MIIQSNYTDYYDHIRSYGEEGVTYKRLTTEIAKSDVSISSLSFLDNLLDMCPVSYCRSKGSLSKLTTYLLGFCGKYYPLYKLSSIEQRLHSSVDTLFSQLREDEEDTVDNLILLFGAAPEYFECGSVYSYYPKKASVYERLNIYEEALDRLTKHSVFQEVQSPVFLYTRNNLILNPVLADFSFFKKVDMYTAYQEIDLYLTSQLSQLDTVPLTTGTDIDIRNSKGFDEMSFKMESHRNKKARRRLNKQRKRSK